MSKEASQNSLDGQAFKTLFDTYFKSIRNFLYYKSGNMELAEDLTQDAFLILWNKKDQIDPSKVKSYLYTIAHNLFLNEIKHQKVVTKFAQRPQIKTASTETPQFLMEEGEFQQKLISAIESLPEKNRIVFLMNRIEKLTYREIAERLELSVKAVEKRMHKALIELRKISAKI